MGVPYDAALRTMSRGPIPLPRSNAHILGRWSTVMLGEGQPAAGIGPGFALLWSAKPIRIGHAGRTTEMLAGDLAIVDRALPLSIEGEAGWTAMLLDLGDRRIGARIDDRQRFVGTPLCGRTDVAQMVKRLWLTLQDIGDLYLGQSEPGDELIEAQIIAILTDLAARLAAEMVDARVTSHDAATIARARLLIAAHLSDPVFGVAELATRMHVSPRHLSSLFARIGTTTSAAILDARLGLARRLLQDPVNARRQISSIALACGFDDQSYFARCFRRYAGVTPRRFRADANSL